MRLTLRTLLAYLDDVLTPADREDLRHRIAASEFASDLIHRVSDTMRRIRLGAPEVLGEGVGADPNTVAEYLDNTMSAEVVPEFERVCLERNSPLADAQLAETAACHHILTMVLGQPVEIDTAARQRMYALLEVAQRNAEASAQAAATPRPAPEPEERMSQTPDYLRAPERPLWVRLAPAIAAVLLLGATCWFAFRPGGPLGPDVAKNNPQPAAPAEPQTPPDGDGEADAGAGEAGQPDAGEPETGQADSGQDDAATPEAGAGDPETATPAAGDTPAEGTASPDTGEEPAPGPAGGPDAGADPGVDDPEMDDLGPALPVESADPSATAAPGAEGGPGPAEGGTPPGATAGEGAAPGPETAGPEIADPEAVDPDAAETDAPVAPPEPREMGRTLPSDQVLLLRDPIDNSWVRLAAKQPLLTGDELLALPTYRPAINLEGEFDVEMLGGTRAQIDVTGETPKLKVVYGRAVITNVAKQPADFRLEAGDAGLDLRIGPGGTVAVDTVRPFRPGLDPMQELAPAETNVFAKAGQSPIEWTWDGEPGGVAAGAEAGWSMRGGVATPSALVAFPLWVVSREAPSTLDETASPRLEKQLVVGEEAWPKLLAAFNSPMKEERYLAAVSSMHVGNFEPFVTSLRDEEQKQAWNQEIQAMRVFMSRSQSLAKAVKDELIVQRPEQGEVMYEMLVGYTPEQVGLTAESRKSGVLKELIDRLESDVLEYRVLAIYNIEKITGRKVGFAPAGTPQNRDRYVRTLRHLLETDGFAPAGAP
ncbi:hypothetical protein Pla175_06150 [Pirellulimonas nuda]|uniref:Uncharacterized protein n=1 Tax=Pirellulimonas nuda TaxID=2528009 RepID=A0A518D706_9BACT|nr:hypothetical protein [Pirellulimonas nuda]QDU87257.1 hypothetical protein Pla175_06150 [Pirellulimonas nuda]